MDADPGSVSHEELLAQGSWLRALARALVSEPDAAEDALQETWMAALRHPPRAGRPVRPWLRAVLGNFARRGRRASARRDARERAADGGGEPALDPERLVEQMTVQQRVIARVLALDEPYRACVLLHYFHGHSAAEIAAREGVDAATVRKRLERARERLRASLGDRREWLPALAAFVPPPETVPAAAAPAAAALGAVLAAKPVVLLVVAAALAVGIAFLRPSPPPSGAPEPPPAPAAGRARETASAEPPAPGSADRPEALAAPAGGARVPVAPAATPPPVPDPATGSLLARVVHAEGGAPAAGVVVVVETRPAGRSWPEVRYVRTDASGAALAGGLAPGEGRVGLLRASPRPVHIAADAETRVELRLRPGITLRGRVVDERGRPVPGADVWLSAGVDVRAGERRHGGRGAAPRGTVVAVADTSGRFELAGVGADQRVGARADGFAPSDLQTPLPSESGAASVVLVLGSELSRASGVVRAADGTPVAGATVVALDPAARSGRTLPDGRELFPPPPVGTSTGGDGTFELGPVATDASRLRVRAPGFALLETGLSLSPGANPGLELVLERTPRVAGLVVDAFGDPVPNARVEAVAEDEPLASTRADASGSFVLDGLPTGPVRLEASRAARGWAATELVLEPGVETRWEAHLRPTPAFFGRLVDASGAPLADWEVAARPEGLGERFESIAVTAEDGAFRIERVPPDGSRLRVHACAPDAWNRFPALIAHDVDPAASPFELRVVDLAAATGALVGAVVDPDGRPVEDALVGLWHQREKLWRGARPEPDGSFRIEHIPPGDVTLDVHAGAFPWVGLGEPSVEGGAVVDVGTVRLEPAGTLAGRLTGLRDGDAARVTLELEGGGTLLGGGGALHRDGRAFASGPLKAGRYTLRAAGDRVETATAECDVVAGRETRVELALRAAAMRRVVISAPAAGEPPYAVACEVQGGERTAWDGWTVLDAPGPRELRVSVAPGTYRLLIRDRYADERVLHDGTLEVHGDARDDVPRVVTLEAPAEPDGE